MLEVSMRYGNAGRQRMLQPAGEDFAGCAPSLPARQCCPRPLRCPARALRRPVLAGGVVGARAGRQASRALRHTDEGERFDDFAIRQEWWTGETLPEATVVRRELAGVPRVEVAGLSREKVEELFWDTITQVRAELAGTSRK